MIRTGKLLLRLLLLLCVSALYHTRSYSQICTTDIFTKHYNLGPPKGQFLIVLPGGGTIFGGRDFYDPNQVDIVKTTSSGDIVFNKRIEGMPNSNWSSAYLNNEKNIIIGTASNLILLDTNGVVLKSAVTSVPWSILYDIKTDEQGNIYALYEATGSDPQQQHVLTKIAPDLSKSLWTMNWGSYYSSYYPGIMVDNDKVFAVGGFPISGFDTTLGSVLCFDGLSGALIKQVSFRLDGYGCTMRTMHKLNDGYLMEGFYHPDGSTIIHNHVVVRLNNSLQPVAASRVTNLFNTDPLFIEPDDQDGFYASGMGVWTNLFHCDNHDSVTWSRVSIDSRSGVGAFAVSSANLYSLDENCGTLLKADLNGFAGGCLETILPMSTVPMIATQATNSIAPVATSVSITNVANTTSDKTFTTGQECKVTSSCSSLNIIGPKIVCTNGTLIIFKGRRNSDCRLPVQWKLGGSSSYLSTINDSTLSVQFQSSRHYQLIGSLPSTCEVIADTLDLDVSVSSQPPLNLGSDKELCAGNTIMLNAQQGYMSYTWQDGSKDAAFTVTSPGLYYVTTTDACGGVYKDTVTITAAPPVPFIVSLDRTKCNDDTIHLSAPSGFMNYSWSPIYNISTTSQADVIVNPSVDTTYFVKAEKTQGCFVYDTIHVTVYYSPAINLGGDQSFCSGDSLIMDAGAGFSSYIWNGVTGWRYKTVRLAGTYSVTATTSDGCSSYDTLQVKNVWPLPQVNLDHNSALCEGYTRKLNPGSFSSYLWQDGSNRSTFTATGKGIYFVQVTDNHNCVGSDTTNITNILPLPSNFLPRDTALCSYSKITLGSSQSYSSYSWYNGSKTTNITIDKPGTYWLEVTDDNNCVGRDSIEITPKQCMVGVYVPTAFSPNQDYKNDVFRALVFGVVKKFELSVYSRWGQRVFYTTDFTKGWDGKVGGRDQQPDVFLWACRYQLEGGQETFDKGTLMLVR